MPCHLHPTSALYGMGINPEWIVYHDLVMTTKEYMQFVTAVDPAWLAEYGSVFYTIKDASQSRLERKRAAADAVKHMEKEMEDAQRQIQQRSEQKEARRKAMIRNTRIVTPGVRTPATPRPQQQGRFGL